MPVVYETKNSKSLPLPLLVMGLLSASLWIGCGIMLWDPWITFPNMFAAVVCFYSFFLCFQFPARYDEKEEDKIEVLDDDENRIDCEHASPLQRMRDYVSGATASSENLALHEAKEQATMYGGTCGTGGTGDSF